MKPKNESYNRISAALLPGAAVAPVLPEATQKIRRLSRSPSPVAIAIATATRVGKSIVGNVRRRSSDTELQNITTRGRSLPPNASFSSTDGLYATVQKPKKVESSVRSEEDSFTSVSEMVTSEPSSTIYPIVNGVSIDPHRKRPTKNEESQNQPKTEKSSSVKTASSEITSESTEDRDSTDFVEKQNFINQKNSENSQNETANPIIKSIRDSTNKSKRSNSGKSQVKANKIPLPFPSEEEFLTMSEIPLHNRVIDYTSLSEEKSKTISPKLFSKEKIQVKVIPLNDTSGTQQTKETVRRKAEIQSNKKPKEEEINGWQSPIQKSSRKLSNEKLYDEPQFKNNDLENTFEQLSDDKEHSQASAGQIVTAEVQRCSPEQKHYLSSESLDKEYLRHMQEVDASVSQTHNSQTKELREHTPVPLLQSSMNSTLSASNFITPQKLIENLKNRPYGRKIRPTFIVDDIPLNALENSSIARKNSKDSTDNPKPEVKRNPQIERIRDHRRTDSVGGESDTGARYLDISTNRHSTEESPSTQQIQSAMTTLQAFLNREASFNTCEQTRSILHCSTVEQQLNENMQNNISEIPYNRSCLDERLLAKERDDLHDQVEALKLIVTRLNQEISNNFQQQPDNNNKINVQYVTGIIQSFDAQRKEKDEIIQSLKESYRQLEGSSVPHENWLQLKQQAKVVLDENEMLIEQREQNKRTIAQLNHYTDDRVEKLQQELNESNSALAKLQRDLMHSKYEVEELRTMCAHLKDSNHAMVTAYEHSKTIDALKHESEQKTNQLICLVEEYKSKLNASNKERNDLALKLANMSAESHAVTTQLKHTTKNVRKLENRLFDKEGEVKLLKEQDAVTRETLSQVIKVAEKNAKERDGLAELLKQQKRLETSLVKRDNKQIEILNNQLNTYKKRSQDKIPSAKDKVKIYEEGLAKVRESCTQELNDLKTIVKAKQKHIDRLEANKSLNEQHFDDLWKSLKENTRR